LAADIPINHHDRFMAVWFAHCASYLVGLTGSALLCFRVWYVRDRLRVIPFLPQTRSATMRAVVLAAIVAFVIWFRFYAH
jgi:hypothetical protein